MFSQPEGARASSACVCDCKRRTHGSCSEECVFLSAEWLELDSDRESGGAWLFLAHMGRVMVVIWSSVAS